MKKIEIYDTTLRDGTQAEDVALTVSDKIRIAQKLDELGVDYIEGGWPGSNPKDSEFFHAMRDVKLKHAKLVAFGATRKFNRDGVDSPGLMLKSFDQLLDCGAKTICLFGKTWDLHVHQALGIKLKDNLKIIFDSISFLTKAKRQVIFDAEHFFDGYKANKKYALECLRMAARGGAKVLVLCDTNGGTLPHEIEKIVREIKKKLRVPLGIHCHNDGELGVANSLAAVRAGAMQVQGTINGIGERCGNANLVSVIAGLELKLGYKTIGAKKLKNLKETARFVDQVLNRTPDRKQAYVGDSAFAHKGGVHVSAVVRNSKTYEHIEPARVGNGQRILLSDLSGLATVRHKLESLGLAALAKKLDISKLLELLKRREQIGYQYEDAEASFALLAQESVHGIQKNFSLIVFEVKDHLNGMTGKPFSEAFIKIKIKDQERTAVASGVGPVHALDTALREALSGIYTQLAEVRLVDYKVRVLSTGAGTSSIVRVHIDFTNGPENWSTVGVSENIIEASYLALADGLNYFLLRHSSAINTEK